MGFQALLVSIVLVLLVYYASLRLLLGARGSRLRGREWIVWLAAMLVFAVAVYASTLGVGGLTRP